MLLEIIRILFFFYFYYLVVGCGIMNTKGMVYDDFLGMHNIAQLRHLTISFYKSSILAS
jgi:hypothetical protein